MTDGRFVLVTTMKNEGPYVLEWVAYNRVIGFDDIIVYTNDCTDGTNEILTRLQELGEVHFRRNKVGRGGIHRSALRQARRLDVFKQAQWVLVADIDEFLNIKTGDGMLPDLMSSLDPKADVVSVGWKIFGSGGLQSLNDEPVLKQFTDAEPDAENGGENRRFVKSLFRRQAEFYRIGLHGPVPHEGSESDFMWCRPGGMATPNRIGNHMSGDFGYEVAQVNHYAVRSVESYLLKKDRGRANHMNHDLSTEYWHRWNRGGMADRTILRHASATQELIEKYKSDPYLSALHDAAFGWHKSRVADLMKIDEYRELRSRIAAQSADNSSDPKNEQEPAFRGAV